MGQYHPFDKDYLLGGFNFQTFSRRGGNVLEFEASYVPFVSDDLTTFGVWGSVGGRFGEDGSQGTPRAGVGLQAGWRLFAGDAGLLYDKTPSGAQPREDSDRMVLRTRLGLAFAWEVFTGGSAQYRRTCCTDKHSWTLCECDHTPVGLSWFVFWGNESRLWLKEYDHTLGISVKVGVGL